LYQYLAGFLQQNVEAFVELEIEKIARTMGLV
jgi:hypothetical protein